MGRGYDHAGLMGYNGIRKKDEPKEPALIKEKKYKLTDLIKNLYIEGKSYEFIAKQYGFSIDVIKNICEGVNAMQRNANKKVRFTKEFFESRAQEMGINLKERLFTFEDIEEMAKKEDIPAKVIATQAARQGVYVSQNKPQKTKDEVKINKKKDIKVELDVNPEIKSPEIKAAVKNIIEKVEKASEKGSEEPEAVGLIKEDVDTDIELMHMIDEYNDDLKNKVNSELPKEEPKEISKKQPEEPDEKPIGLELECVPVEISFKDFRDMVKKLKAAHEPLLTFNLSGHSQFVSENLDGIKKTLLTMDKQVRLKITVLENVG